MAVWSLVLAILTLGGLGSVAGIVMGLAARRRITATAERGAGLAMAGVVVGAVTLLAAIGFWIFIGVHVAGGSTGGSGGGFGGY